MNIIKAARHGILLPDYGIGFDGSTSRAQHPFITHAHADHMPRRSNKPVYCTPNTFLLMQKRGYSGEAQLLDFGEPLALPNARVTLFPAGHILGSAMVYVETDEGSLLYTGDCRTPPSPASEGFNCPQQIDYLITEATFGLPIYKWAAYDELISTIQQFAVGTLNKGYTPVFLAYSLGKAQEIMHMLAPVKWPVQIHEAGYKLCGIYERADIDLGNYEVYNRNTCEGKILIAPRRAVNNGFAADVKDKRTAYCSGWAVRASASAWLTADKRIPLSDHLDFFELINLCKRLHPRNVIITHTPNASVVQHYLSKLNIASWLLDVEQDYVD
jgi:putative mRNA 3-end processing factor